MGTVMFTIPAAKSTRAAPEFFAASMSALRSSPPRSGSSLWSTCRTPRSPPCRFPDKSSIRPSGRTYPASRVSAVRPKCLTILDRFDFASASVSVVGVYVWFLGSLDKGVVEYRTSAAPGTASGSISFTFAIGGVFFRCVGVMSRRYTVSRASISPCNWRYF